MEGRPTFIFRKRYFNQIAKLTTEQKAELLDKICEYQSTGAFTVTMDSTDMLMQIMIDDWNEDNEKYLETCERNKTNGKLGGRPRKNLKNPVGLQKPKKADYDNDIKENSISKDILKEKQTLYASYYGKSKGIDEKVCNKLIDDKLKQGITLDTIKKCMVLYNCECRIKQDFKYVKKLETWLKEFQPPNDGQLDERLYSVIKSFRDKKKSDDKFGQSSPAKTLWNDLKTTFGDDKVKSLWKQVNSINLTFT